MGEFIRTGLIGHPTGHSKSPLIHNHWIGACGLSGEYVAIDVMGEALAQEIERLKREGFKGFNVTIPHKQAVMALCDELDEPAREIGAVNTVVIGGNGALHGSNTDAFGFLQNLREEAPDFAFGKAPAVVLGSGGAARAIIYALLKTGVPEIRLANRTRARAEDLVANCVHPERIRIVDWDDRDGALGDASLLVNTTSVGMAGTEMLGIDLGRLPQGATVYDIVYVPLLTGLLESARDRGLTIVTGIGMLLHQARPAFKAWYGVLPEVTNELVAKVLV